MFDGGDPAKFKATHFVLWSPDNGIMAALPFQVTRFAWQLVVWGAWTTATKQ
jgi:hypothetical protein